LKSLEHTSCCSFQVAVLLNICVSSKNCQSATGSVMLAMLLNRLLVSLVLVVDTLGACYRTLESAVHGARWRAQDLKGA
jgi:hypothetical protein